MYDLYACNERDSARYLLGRSGERMLYVVGLNPSTANRERGDTTVTKTERIARAAGFDGFAMLNLYPMRSTDPRGLHKRQNRCLAEANLRQVQQLVEHEDQPVFWAAWGGDIGIRNYLKRALCEMMALVDAQRGHWVHYATLRKDGHPRHPSRARYGEAFSPFDPAEYLKRMR